MAFLYDFGADRPFTAALDKGTNLSFGLRYPSNLFRMLLKEATGKQHKDTCEPVRPEAPFGT